ncbi:hypothetical protein Tco_0249228, partial [Tanacetum coccineum]
MLMYGNSRADPVGESSSRGVGAYETQSIAGGALKEKTKENITPSTEIRRRRSVVERTK